MAAPGGSDGDAERVNAFRVGPTVLFRHYFDGDAVFEQLKPYYEFQEYRFSVPASRFPQVQAFLADRGYDLTVADDPERYAVCCRKYRTHPENIFKASVLQRSAGDHTVFVLRSEEAVDRAVDQGATPLAETDLSLSLE